MELRHSRLRTSVKRLLHSRSTRSIYFKYLLRKISGFAHEDFLSFHSLTDNPMTIAGDGVGMGKIICLQVVFVNEASGGTDRLFPRVRHICYHDGKARWSKYEQLRKVPVLSLGRTTRLWS